MGRPQQPPRLKRRSNGYFYIVGFGKSRGDSTGTKDVREATVALTEWLQDQARHDTIASPFAPLLVTEALDIYLREHVDPDQKVAGRVVIDKESPRIHAEYLKRHFVQRAVKDLDETDFVNPDPAGAPGYIQLRAAGKIWLTRDPKPASAGTILREIGTLMASLHYCVKHKDPVTKRRRLSLDDIPKVPLPAQPPPRDRWLTAAEEDALVAAIPMEYRSGRLTRLYRYVILALETGGRPQAVQEAKWFQVNWKARYVDLARPGEAQTNKRRAKCKLSARGWAMLERARREARSEFILDRPGSTRKSFERLVAACGLQDVTRYTLRHTWGTRAAQNRVSMREIADQLGDSIKTVEKNYYHHSPDYRRASADWRDEERANDRRSESGN